MSSEPPSRPHPSVRTLSCPYCGAAIDVAEAQLIDGAAVACASCGARPMLTREWIGHSGTYHWDLVEAGDDDEPE